MQIDRLAVAAEAEGLVGVGRGRPGHGVGLLLGLRLLGQVDVLPLLLLQVEREGELVVFVPGHLVLAHPERRDLDGMLRALRPCRAWLRRPGCPSRRCRRGSGPSRTSRRSPGWSRRRSSSRRPTARRRFLRRRSARPWRAERPAPRGRQARRTACEKRLTFGMLQKYRPGMVVRKRPSRLESVWISRRGGHHGFEIRGRAGCS